MSDLSLLNRSFSRRIGKSLSNLQKNLLESDLPNHLFSNEKLHDESCKILLEIGFGMGEHFIHQAKANPHDLFIGAEVYLNGVANVLKLAQEHKITNFLLWPNNLDMILDKLPDNLFTTIYILFPDPWPKNKQKKKRILNKERLNLICNKLKSSATLIFASDIEDYFYSVVRLIQDHPSLKIINNEDYLQYPENYIPTKYHQKAISEQRVPRFLQAVVCLDNFSFNS